MNLTSFFLGDGMMEHSSESLEGYTRTHDNTTGTLEGKLS